MIWVFWVWVVVAHSFPNSYVFVGVSSYLLLPLQSLRGGGRELRPQNKKLQKPCTLYKRLMRQEDGTEDASWDCLLDLADGTGFIDVPNDIDLSTAVSGVTTLFAPDMVVVEEGRSALIGDPSQAVLGESHHDQDRRLAVTTGNVNVVVVLV